MNLIYSMFTELKVNNPMVDINNKNLLNNIYAK